MNKKKGSGFFNKTVGDSRILSLLVRLVDRICKTARQSLVGGFLTSYDKSAQKAKDGFFAGITAKLSIDRKLFSPVKRAVSKGTEQSIVLMLLRKFYEFLLMLKMSMLGLFMMAFGVSTLFVRFLKIYLIHNESLSFASLLLPFIICVSAFPLLFSNESIAASLCGSRIMSLLIFDFLGLKRVSLERLTELRSFGSGMLIFGVLSGALTYVVPIGNVIAFILILISAAIVLSSPETGIVLLFLGLPFISAHRLAVFVFFIFCAYMFKLLCGKRTLKFDILDISVLLFSVLLVVGGFISFDRLNGIKPSLMYTCFIAAYFLVINLIKSRAWLRRCFAAVVASSFAACVYGIVQRYIDTDRIFTSQMFISPGGKTVAGFASPDILGVYLIMTFPFALVALLLAKKGKNKLGMLIVTFVCILCLLYTESKAAWLSAAVGLLVFFLIYSKKTLSFGMPVLCILPALSVLIPREWLTYLSTLSAGVMPISDRYEIWHGTLRMIKNNFIGGIGTGVGAFQAVYPRYAVRETDFVPHSFNLYLEISAELGIFGFVLFMCIMLLWLRKNVTMYSNEYCPREGRLVSCACVSGIAAALINGCTDHIWSNYRVFLMFWLVMALAVSSYGIYMREIEKKRCRSESDVL